MPLLIAVNGRACRFGGWRTAFFVLWAWELTITIPIRSFWMRPGFILIRPELPG
ncbi:hypothetical protein EVA_14701 [gut metagenome]|uniref:Uncharacterized protein n=1 Tax=gut metagenome TaxID=749906 RepID=J9G5W9_9ZZZZ